MLYWGRQWCLSQLSGGTPATLVFSLSCANHPRNEAIVWPSVICKLQGSPQDLTLAEGSYFQPHLETLSPSLYSGKTARCATERCLGLSDKLWPLEEHRRQATAEMLLLVVWGGGVERPTLAPKVHHMSPTWGGGGANTGEAWEKLPEIPHVSCIPKSQTPHWKPRGRDCKSFLQEMGVNTACV